MFGILFKIYTNIKTVVIDYFYPKKDNVMLTNISQENIIKINEYKTEIEKLETKINVDNMYKCLKNLDKSFSKNSDINDILDFLKYEEEMLYSNKDNLNISVESIQKNTYIINLKKQFIILNKIQKKKELIEKLTS